MDLWILGYTLCLDDPIWCNWEFSCDNGRYKKPCDANREKCLYRESSCFRPNVMSHNNAIDTCGDTLSDVAGKKIVTFKNKFFILFKIMVFVLKVLMSHENIWYLTVFKLDLNEDVRK